MNTGRYTLSELLFSSEIERIIIPELQRDYVWGTHNVRGLMMSVLENFNNRKMLSLEIKTAGSGQEIEDEIKKYLVLEYNKLHSNTRIGFIYAYHDKEYAEQFFLRISKIEKRRIEKENDLYSKNCVKQDIDFSYYRICRCY